MGGSTVMGVSLKNDGLEWTIPSIFLEDLRYPFRKPPLGSQLLFQNDLFENDIGGFMLGASQVSPTVRFPTGASGAIC